MLRHHMLRSSKRLYHESSTRQRTPVAKTASQRVSRSFRDRQNAQAQPKLTQYDPSKKFQPFPFAVTEANKLEVLRKQVTPLYDIPYDEQLASKQSYCRNSLRYLAQQLYKLGTPVRLDIRKLPCPVNPIVRSEHLEGYRNKDEFSIWRGHDGKTPTVGFMAYPLGKHGDTVCIEPNGCSIMKEASIMTCDILQDFIRNHSKLGVCFSLGVEGGWRRFIVKSNHQDELMLTGFASPVTLRVQEIVDERNRFRDFILRRMEKTGLNLKSLYFQPCPHNKCLHRDVPFELLYGEPTLKETINGYKFEVSPESYMPESSRGAELLFETIRKTISDYFPTESKPLVIDTLCGAGVLAIHLANLASKVVGIDQSSQAIEDARTNALKNRVKNADFFNMQVEIGLERVLEKYSKYRGETLVVCYPKKVGLHRHVVEALRKCPDVKKIIYVASKADGDQVIDNLIQLCQRGRDISSSPFTLVAATPVDIYPHLQSCELILALERMPD